MAERKTNRARRGRGEGSISQRANGRWCARIDVGYDTNGKRRRRIVYGKTKAEVQAKLLKLQSLKSAGTLNAVEKATVAEFLDRWLNDAVRLSSAGTTFARYTSICGKHVKPRIGGVKIATLSPAHVQAMLSAMETDGAGIGTLVYAYAVLRNSLNTAVKWGLTIRNACDAITPPRPKRRDIQPLSVEQTRGLLAATEGNRLHALFVLAVSSGLRQGELFGLQWEDVDLGKSTLTVRHTLEEVKGKLKLKEPKSSSGRRAVRIGAAAVAALWQHKAKMLAEGLAAVPWVFCDTDGNPLRKSNVERRTWKPLREAAGLADTVRFHDLRHSHASLLLSEGVNAKVIQERLGHSTIKLTLDTYSHLPPGMQDHAADQMDRLLG